MTPDRQIELLEEILNDNIWQTIDLHGLRRKDSHSKEHGEALEKAIAMLKRLKHPTNGQKPREQDGFA